jgi:predicted RNase H-like nuclease
LAVREVNGNDRARLRRSRRDSQCDQLAGVDGCRGGWFVVLVTRRDGAPIAIDYKLCPSFADVLRDTRRARCVAVDMPIGLLDAPVPGGRDCDRAARAILGRPRASSVFTPPTRAALAATEYRQAIALNQAGMSKEAFNILAKIREVDLCLDRHSQRRLFEAHPELTFAMLIGRPCAHNKKTPVGRRERERALKRFYGSAYVKPQAIRQGFPLAQLGLDDIVDAYALTISAMRILEKTAVALPHGSVQRDAAGLRMEICF